MVFTQAKSYEEIVDQLEMTDVITIISCSSCARTAGTGGEEPMRELAMKLRADGYKVLDGYTINTVCTPKVIQAKLNKNVNTLVCLACSAGSSNMMRMFDGYKIVETTIDVGLMTGDNKEKAIKIAMPYEASMDTKGRKFEMFSGKAISIDHVSEVAK